jgi:copper chaperone CopZ
MKKCFTVMVGSLAGFALVINAQGQAPAETKVELKRVHMCCEGCSGEVEAILKKVAGVKGVMVDQEAKVARFVARDVKTAQGALDALAAAGFHGDSGTEKFSFKDDSGVKPGKVKSLTLTGFHNTCPGCVQSFRKAIKDVPGITGDNLKPKVTTCEIKGDFDAVKLVQALNKAGLHAKVKN